MRDVADAVTMKASRASEHASQSESGFKSDSSFKPESSLKHDAIGGSGREQTRRPPLTVHGS